MPTYEALDRFWSDFTALSADQQRAFMSAVQQVIEDLRRGEGFRKGLRVKGIRGSPGIFEMTWADDGRATFQFGTSPHKGEAHIIWRRVGSHDVFRNP
jgi:hypothetical protein